MAKYHDEKRESVLEPILAGLGVLLVFGLLIWLVASNRIVYATLKPALFFGSMWKWWPTDFTISQWNAIVQAVTEFAPQPWTVSFLSWASLITLAFRPLAVMLMVVFLISLAFVVRNPHKLRRKFTADSLMQEAVATFTGVAPVVAIRQAIAKNVHPLWRKQVAPEEVFLQYRVPADAPGTLAAAGSPMVRDGRFDREVARCYFMGLRKPASKDLAVSLMLGRQLVNLVADARNGRSIVFSDRASAEGKTLFALWSAVAFGGEAGRAEFCQYRDMLNRSAYGTKDGMANLSLAQPLYDKYRKHPSLNKIFAIHHWEHTALFFLLSLAQKKGRFTTAEVLWLRPTNRVMYFALNSRGSYTPHTEAAATFAQHAFEAACARAGRLPLVRSADGQLLHSVYIEKAVDGLELEYVRWAEGTDSEDDWWARKDIWRTANAAVLQHAQQSQSSIPASPLPGASAADTPFDVIAAAQQAQAERQEQQNLLSQIGQVFPGSQAGASAAGPDLGAAFESIFLQNGTGTNVKN